MSQIFEALPITADESDDAIDAENSTIEQSDQTIEDSSVEPQPHSTDYEPQIFWYSYFLLFVDTRFHIWVFELLLNEMRLLNIWSHNYYYYTHIRGTVYTFFILANPSFFSFQ